MKAVLSAAVALLIGVAALTLAHPGEMKAAPGAASAASDLRGPIAQHVLQDPAVR
jgi:hypothetical protein